MVFDGTLTPQEAMEVVEMLGRGKRDPKSFGLKVTRIGVGMVPVRLRPNEHFKAGTVFSSVATVGDELPFRFEMGEAPFVAMEEELVTGDTGPEDAAAEDAAAAERQAIWAKLDTPIAELGLPTRLERLLFKKFNDISYVGELVTKRIRVAGELPNGGIWIIGVGRRSRSRIEAALEDLGLRLGMTVAELQGWAPPEN